MVSAPVGAEQTSSGRLAPRQGARVLLMDGTAVESAFALLLTKVTKPENVEIYRWEMKKCRER